MRLVLVVQVLVIIMWVKGVYLIGDRMIILRLGPMPMFPWIIRCVQPPTPGLRVPTFLRVLLIARVV